MSADNEDSPRPRRVFPGSTPAKPRLLTNDDFTGGPRPAPGVLPMAGTKADHSTPAERAAHPVLTNRDFPLRRDEQRDLQALARYYEAEKKQEYRSPEYHNVSQHIKASVSVLGAEWFQEQLDAPLSPPKTPNHRPHSRQRNHYQG